VNELGAAAPCDLAGKWNDVSVTCTLMAREGIVTDVMRHLDQSFSRLVHVPQERGWSLLATVALQSSSICFTSAVCVSVVLFSHTWP